MTKEEELEELTELYLNLVGRVRHSIEANTDKAPDESIVFGHVSNIWKTLHSEVKFEV